MKITTTQIIAWTVSAGIAAAVIAGFVTFGTPAEERARRLDNQRVSDLQSISYAIDSYYNREKAMPATLKDLSTEQDVYIQSIADPDTQQVYPYQVKAATSYELCADFVTDSSLTQDIQQPAPYGDFWKHSVGHTCYTLDVRLQPGK